MSHVICVLSVSHYYNSSLVIDYSGHGSSKHIMDTLELHHGSVLLPDYRSAAEAMRRKLNNNKYPHFAIFIEICEQLNGLHSLFTIYSSFLHRLPVGLIGPNVIAHEAFLDAFEYAVSPYLLGDAENGLTSLANSLKSLNLETKESYDLQDLVTWPKGKHIILHSESTGESSTYLLESYIEGLSDGLDRLGTLNY